MSKIIISYVPVLHEGYRMLIEDNKDAETFYVLGSEFIAELDYLSKEIRALSPELIQSALQSWNLGPKVEILTKGNMKGIQEGKDVIVLSKEDVMRRFADLYLKRREILYSPIFLRWDRHNSVEQTVVKPDEVVTSDAFHQRMMKAAMEESDNSSDWWRRVGAVIIKDKEIVLSGSNTHLPSPHTPYAEGDPRNGFHKGVHLELSTSLHIEAGLVAEAARTGIALLGAEMYATDFPCPPCAKQIAGSGIKTLYFKSGYGILDGEKILRDKGVKIIRVDM